MSNIPGLLLCPVDDVSEGGIELPSFTENIFVPDSHRHGNCRAVNEFERLSVISDGSFGTMYKCRDKRTNEIYALKKFRMPASLEDGIPSSILREINILNTLKHVNLVNSHGTVAGRSLESNYIILDYGVYSLDELMNRCIDLVSEKAMIKFIMLQLFRGLEYIHGGLIIHRDICCKNIVFTASGLLKITGFCSSRFYGKGNMTPAITELQYRAPELLFQAKVYGPAIDMWSAGCVFARLLLKRMMFPGNSELEVLRSIFNVLGTPSETIWPGFNELFLQMDEGNRAIENEIPYSDLRRIFVEESASSKDLVQELIVYFPNARMNAQNCLKCSYFSDSLPASTTDDMASILRNVETAGDPIVIE